MLLTKFSYLCTKKMRIATVILDFDGTLGDSRRIIVDTLRETLRQHNLPVSNEEQCAATIGLPLKEAFVMLANVDEDTAMKCVNTYRSIFDVNNVTGAVKPFANVVDTIKQMHAAGLTLTIASSRFLILCKASALASTSVTSLVPRMLLTLNHIPSLYSKP